VDYTGVLKYDFYDNILVMKRDYRWDDFVSFLLNTFALIFIMPFIGIYKLIKKLIVDVSKKVYKHIVAFVALLVFVALLSLLIK